MAGAYGWQPYHLHVSTVLKSGSLNLLEPSGPVQACNELALPFTSRTQPPVHWVPGVSPELRAAGAWRWSLTPFECRGQESVELYLYSPYGPCGLYRASVPVQGCTLPYLYVKNYVVTIRTNGYILNYSEFHSQGIFLLFHFSQKIRAVILCL